MHSLETQSKYLKKRGSYLEFSGKTDYSEVCFISGNHLSALSSSCSATNRNFVVSVAHGSDPKMVLQGEEAMQPAAGHRAADQLHLQKHAEHRAHLVVAVPSLHAVSLGFLSLSWASQ